MSILKKMSLILFVIIQAGCSSGQDGDLFLRFRAVLEPIEFIIDNPDVPQYPEYDIYYKVNPGTYSFSYIDHNGTQHPQPGEFGFIDLIADPGSDGGLFKSGSDGKDLYIDLILLSTGPLIENFDYYTIASTLEYDD
tara:strand:- start:7882 stop:8292 length:411 start_codon:yes stop_codon:yes gene_type:complete